MRGEEESVGGGLGKYVWLRGKVENVRKCGKRCEKGVGVGSRG